MRVRCRGDDRREREQITRCNVVWGCGFRLCVAGCEQVGDASQCRCCRPVRVVDKPVVHDVVIHVVQESVSGEGVHDAPAVCGGSWAIGRSTVRGGP